MFAKENPALHGPAARSGADNRPGTSRAAHDAKLLAALPARRKRLRAAEGPAQLSRGPTEPQAKLADLIDALGDGHLQIGVKKAVKILVAAGVASVDAAPLEERISLGAALLASGNPRDVRLLSLSTAAADMAKYHARMLLAPVEGDMATLATMRVMARAVRRRARLLGIGHKANLERLAAAALRQLAEAAALTDLVAVLGARRSDEIEPLTPHAWTDDRTVASRTSSEWRARGRPDLAAWAIRTAERPEGEHTLRRLVAGLASGWHPRLGPLPPATAGTEM